MNHDADPRSDRPIGVFDSGIGGLTVVRQLMRHLPHEHILYFGDSARVPYGTKSPETVTRFALESARFLTRRDVKFLIVACNTSSAVALSVLQRRFDVPMIGVIEPGVQAAVRSSRSRRIGVIGTQATITSGAYERMILGLAPDAVVSGAACPLFVPLAEEGWTSGPVVDQVGRIYLEPLRSKRIDCLILGCTHYPLLKEAIAAIMGPEITLIDTAEETVRLVRKELEHLDLLRREQDEGTHSFFVSDVPAQFSAVGGRFLGQPMLEVEWVDQSDLPWFER